MPKAHILVKNRFQKRLELYEDILSPNILEDVCRRVTGQTDYTVDFDNTDYNKGRLATIEYEGTITYVSFSEAEIKSRNSSLQSFPSALINYHKEKNPYKRICFYFLPSTGNFEIGRASWRERV